MNETDLAQTAMNADKSGHGTGKSDARMDNLPDWWLRMTADADRVAREENERIQRWLIEDDPERPAKLARLNADPDEIARASAFQKRVDELVADGIDPQLASVCAANDPNFGHWKALIHRGRYAIATEPKINAPERLQWWMGKNVDDAHDDFNRYRRAGLNPSLPELIEKQVNQLHQASDYADEIWRANPSLPRIPTRQTDDVRTWKASLLTWCIDADRAMKAAPANLPDPTHADKLPVGAPARPKTSPADKMLVAFKYVANNGNATQSEVESVAGFGERYFTRNKLKWKLIQQTAGKIRKGQIRFDDDGNRIGVDALDE